MIRKSYLPNARNEKIQIANESFAHIAGKGHICPIDGLTLQNVLHVPKMSYDVLSISKITRYLNCQVVFSLENVFSQSLSSRKTIDTARHNR